MRNFKVWDKNRNKFLESGEILLGKIVAWKNNKEFTIEFLDDYDVVQSTGLFDKNGVEIFEGHIFDECMSVRWNYKQASFEFYFIFNGESCNGDINWCEAAEWLPEQIVIGNIYENPELLENTK